MFLGHIESQTVKGYFQEFKLETFFNGKAITTKNVYFRNEKCFMDWLQEVRKKCTGPCSVWSYDGRKSENKKTFYVEDILSTHYSDSTQRNYLLYYNEDLDYIS